MNNCVLPKMLYWFSKPLVGSYAEMMLKMDVRIQEPIPHKPVIFAANHPTTVDPFFVAAFAKRQVHILIKDLLFDVPILGAYLRSSGHIAVRNDNGAEVIETAVNYLNEGKSILIFPEGSLSPLKGGYCPTKTGAARLAMMSGAPIIPVGIHINRNAIHQIKSTVKSREDVGNWYFKGPYFITAGNPMYLNGDVENRQVVRSAAENIMHRIKECAWKSEQRIRNGPSNLVELPVT